MTQSADIVDVAAWVGAYPFRGIPRASLRDLLDHMQRLNITTAVISSFEEVFWENNLDAFEHWHDRLSASPQLIHWPVVNPAMPGQLGLFERLVDAHDITGLRLLPNYHGYTLTDACVEPLMQLAHRRNLVVQVFVRLADERWHWMLKVPAVSDGEIHYLLARYADQSIIISGFQPVSALGASLRLCPRAFADISRQRGPVFGIETLVKDTPPGQLLFGSLWPIQIIDATLWPILDADIDEADRNALLYGNAKRLLGGDIGSRRNRHAE